MILQFINLMTDLADTVIFFFISFHVEIKKRKKNTHVERHVAKILVALWNVNEVCFTIPFMTYFLEIHIDIYTLAHLTCHAT